MSSAHRNDRRNLLRRITVEHLEHRELMAADVATVFDSSNWLSYQSAQEWAESALFHGRIERQPPSSGEVKHFQSKAESENFVVDRLVAQWQDFLGKPLDKSFLIKHQLFPTNYRD